MWEEGFEGSNMTGRGAEREKRDFCEGKSVGEDGFEGANAAGRAEGTKRDFCEG